ncbi:NUDIX domain-containing protein [Candidatus Parcubacteria bacterium]|nr:NUDIX domain-containing protein [Candidatus Parcubacteria bacterium]
MANYFQGTAEHPQHLSVGAIVVNDKGEMLCHRFRKELLEANWPEWKGVDELYLFMRETLDPAEPLERALLRGLIEEFGIVAEIIDYIGSLKGSFWKKEVEVEKTTLYFLCKYSSGGFPRDMTDAEGASQLMWLSKDTLLKEMKEQEPKGKIDTTVRERSILERAMGQYPEVFKAK